MAELGDQLATTVASCGVDDVVAHALVFPLPTMGHIVPLFQLSQVLASTGIRCTFLTPPRYHPHLQQILANSAAADTVGGNLRLLTARDGLPSDAPYDLPLDADWLASVDQLEVHVDELLQQDCYTCLISDNTVLTWVQGVADRNGIPRLDFWPFSATVVSRMYHMSSLESRGFVLPEFNNNDVDQKGEDTMVSCIPGLPPIRAAELAYVKDKLFHRSIFKVHERVDAAERVLIHTAFDLEPDVITGLRLSKEAVYPVGPLLSVLEQPRTHKTNPCLEWLDTQAPLTVLYIAFGTTGHWTPSDFEHLAKGLQASKQPFLCVLRPSGPERQFADLLSGEALEHGLIVPWAPQPAVLQHPSVGGFLTHCGWNSVIESLYAGVPMIGWPKFADQAINMGLIAKEWKVGIALSLSLFTSVDSVTIETAVKALMHGDEGKHARQRAAKIKDTLRSAAAASTRDNLRQLVLDMSARARAQAQRK